MYDKDVRMQADAFQIKITRARYSCTDGTTAVRHAIIGPPTSTHIHVKIGRARGKGGGGGGVVILITAE